MKKVTAELKQTEKLWQDLAAGAPERDEDVYQCVLCRDSGYILQEGRARLCSCQDGSELALRQVQAGLSKRLARMTFASFRLEYYPEDRVYQGLSYRKLAERALRDCRELAAGRLKEGLLLTGDVGCGKTHLAAAIANQRIEEGREVLFQVTPEFLGKLKASYRRDNEAQDESEIIDQACTTPLLILDDMGAHNFTDWVRNNLFTIINHRYNNDLPCVITTNLSLEELEDKIGERCTSRLLEMCRLHQLLADQDIRTGVLLGGRRV